MIHEMLWFLSSYDQKYNKFGNTNIRYLLDNKVTFWTEWCYENYRRERLKKYQENDLIDDKTVKPFKSLNQKDFEKRIMTDDDFALKYGDLGGVYGKQWVDWGGHYEYVEKTKQYNTTKSDTVLVNKLGIQKVYLKGINQIDNIIEELIDNPDSRRMVVNAWNVEDLDDMLLQPCHYTWQVYTKVIPLDNRFDWIESNINSIELKEYLNKNGVAELNDIRRNIRKVEKIFTHFSVPERWISLKFTMRSCDCYLGTPYNISGYALLLSMIAQTVNMIPDELTFSGGDVHIYDNAIAAVEEILKREPRDLPQLKLNPDIQNIYGFRIEDIEIIGYDPHPNIAVDVAV